MNESSQIRALFLRNFVKALIISSSPELQEKIRQFEAQPAQKPQLIPIIAIPREALRREAELQTKSQPQVLESLPPKVNTLKEPLVQEEMTASRQVPISIISTQQITPAMMTVPPSAVKVVSKEETTGVSMVDKINAVVSDAAVQSLECKGAGKPLILNKGGFMQTLNFTLTNDDIKLILLDFASKTRIPLLPGVFKVAYQNLLVTAVVSEFIGNRFLIQKRQPQQPLPLPINAPVQPQRALPARNLPQARPTAPPSMYRK